MPSALSTPRGLRGRDRGGGLAQAPVRGSSELYEASGPRSESRVDGLQHVIGRGLRRLRVIDR